MHSNAESDKKPNSGFVYEFLEETSVHGLNLIQKNKPLSWKLIWTVIFVGATTITINGLVDIWKLYAEKTMSTEYNLGTDSNIAVPDLVLCTMNRFNTSKLNQLNISFELAAAFNTAIHVGNANENSDLLNEYDQLKRETGLTSFEEVLMAITSTCEEVIESCAHVDGAACCAEDVKEKLSRYGRCFQISGEKVQYRPVTVRLPTSNEKSFRSTMKMSFGLLLWVYEPTLETYDFVGTIEPGKDYQFEVSLEVIESVNNPPKYSCKSDADYNHFTCMGNCYGKSPSEQLCECEIPNQFWRDINITVITEDQAPLCDPWTIGICKRAMNEAPKDSLELNDPCLQKCPLHCTRKKFRVTYFDAVTFDADAIRENQAGNGNFSLEEYVGSRAKFKFHMVHDYVHIRQYLAVNFDQVLSYLGGQLGLFLGCSVLTVVHVIIFCTYMCAKSIHTHAGLPIARQLSRVFSTRKKRVQKEQQMEPVSMTVSVNMEPELSSYGAQWN